ncbi:MAG: cation diffusion facilitator family transporter [Methylococcales bacterium]|nr:cation diffusion facilitator family transporter [Methylococcales bacterium]
MAEISEIERDRKLKAKASYVGAAINISQTLLKIGFGMLWQSSALIADGIHSLSDLLSDFLVIVAVRMGSREADHEHPYGHRRFETIATIILGLSLIIIGGGIAWSVMKRMEQPEHLSTPDVMSLGIVAISILVNEWLYHYTKRIAKTTRSKLLLANAWHQRSDAISSVVVLFGIGAVLLGYPLADAIAAIVVALMVVKIGLSQLIASIKELVDTSLPPHLLAEIRAAILAIEGVEGIHLLRSRQMGEDALLDAHVIVDPRITVSEGHNISEAVRDELVSRFDDVMDVLVHIDAENDEGKFEKTTPLYRRDVKALLDNYLAAVKSDIIDFKIHYLEGQVEVEVILPFFMSEQAEQLTQLKAQCEQMKLDLEKIAKVLIFFKI